jgi:hypothetical protein
MRSARDPLRSMAAERATRDPRRRCRTRRLPRQRGDHDPGRDHNSRAGSSDRGTRAALASGIRAAPPGATLRDVGAAVERTANERGSTSSASRPVTASAGRCTRPRPCSTGQTHTPARRRCRRGVPSLSTSGETLTIEESMTLRARTDTAGHVGYEHEWSWRWASGSG